MEIRRAAAAGRPALAADSPGPIGRWEPIALAAEGYWSRIYRARPLASPAGAAAAYALKAIRPERDGKLALCAVAREAVVGGSVSHPTLVAVLERAFPGAPSSSCLGSKAER